MTSKVGAEISRGGKNETTPYGYIELILLGFLFSFVLFFCLIFIHFQFLGLSYALHQELACFFLVFSFTERFQLSLLFIK